jgi:formylglycine-generating enzyme required for sulfatase activity
LARTQVTRVLYQEFLDDSGHEAPGFWCQREFVRPRMPAVGVSWNDATAYCVWSSEVGKGVVRLPTEAEWEYAAKGGRDVLYPWGDQPPESLPDYEKRWLDGPEPVDAYPSLHPWNFLGLGENVHEWCADWYDASYYDESPANNPTGPEFGRRRSSRGGAWRHQIKVSRCSARSSIPPDKRYSDYGFRLAADLGR